MKRILITGAGSYLGTRVERFLAQWPDDYQIDTVSLHGAEWKARSFAEYDTVFHVAGIAHIKETAENAHQYYAVNRDLAVETAEKAKADGAGQFIFLSSASVYGMVEGTITKQTKPAPVSAYGASKWEAEQALTAMRSETFQVAVLRAPMVYGDGCKGNYQALVKIARRAPVFADYSNQRSMIAVERLAEFVKTLVDERRGGIFFPQDPSYVCTCQMIRQIAQAEGKRLPLTPLLDPAIWLLKACSLKGKKAFGDLIYEGFDPCIEEF